MPSHTSPSREMQVQALLGAIELYRGLEEERYLVYDKKRYRFYDQNLHLMAKRRKALEDILKDVRAR